MTLVKLKKMNSDKSLTIDKTRCIYCSGCVAVCPFTALELEETNISVNEKCTMCTLCIKFCPVNAIGEKEDGRV